jgi:hypothetical protein
MQEWEVRQLAAIRVLINIAKRLTPEELADCLKQAEAKESKKAGDDPAA